MAIVKTNANANSVVFDTESKIYRVSVRARAVDGEANVAVMKLLSDYLKIPKSKIRLKTGFKSKTKRFEII